MTPRWPLLVVALLLGCRSKPPAADPDQVEITELVETVEAIRRLRRKAPITVDLVDPGAFRKSLVDDLVIDERAIESERAWLVAFSFAPWDINLGKVADTAADAYSASYDSKLKRLMVPRGKSYDSIALGHEVAHALADQHFGTRLDKDVLNDAATAFLSLVEGDASAVDRILSARANLAGPGAALAWAAAREGDSEAALVEATPAFGSWVPIYRDELFLRYTHGLRFVAALHMAGGFPLVDGAWKKPPTTTEQILHPEKYIAGEGAIPVEVPATPEGMTRVVMGNAGELGVRTLLSLCQPERIAHQAAAGWGGDVFAVERRADGGLALIWPIVFDDDASAARFEKALDLACWDKRLDPRAKMAATRVVREGAKLVITRGVDDPAVAASAMKGIGHPLAPAPPIGPVSLKPFPTSAPVEPTGRFVGHRYELPEFGLALEVPNDMNARLDGPAGVFLRGPGNHAHVSTYVVDTPAAAKVHKEFIDSIVAAFDGAAVIDAGHSRVDSPFGAADEYRSIVGATNVRVTIASLCGGLRRLVVLAWWHGEQNGALYDETMHGLERTNVDPSACR